MILVCGMNENCQLNENRCRILNPGSKISINPTSIQSYSVLSHHSVFITKNGTGIANGDNLRCVINPSLPWKDLVNSDFSIKSNMIKINIISAMCGWHYTLYLVSISRDQNILAYTYEGNHSFVSITVKNSYPIALFGGGDNCASIDSNGQIIYIPKIIEESRPPFFQTISLPNREKAISLSCCDKFIVALSSSGRVYMSKEAESFRPTFSMVYELRDIHIVNISGGFMHAFAVSDDGSVYGIGVNYFGKLGLSKDVEEAENFVKIQSLSKYTIVEAYAGRHHSLFRTSQGKVLACGSNYLGEFPNVAPSDTDYFNPIDTGLSGALFCIAGNCVSAVFFNYVPPNVPNKATVDIRNQSKPVSPSKTVDSFESRSSGDSQARMVMTLKKRITQLEQERSIELEKASKAQQEINKLHDMLKVIDSKNEKFPKNAKKKLIDVTFLDVSDIDKLTRIKVLGGGGQSVVTKVWSELFQSHFALKELIMTSEEKRANRIEFSKIRRFFQEYEILNKLNHPNIIKTFGFCTGDNSHPASILLELEPYNLVDVVEEMTNIERVTSIYEICIAMDLIHKNNMIHRDLKPGNILLDENKHIKISDFGISCVVDIQTQTSRTAGIGTLKYLAPELLNESTHYNEKVDVYAFGIVMFYILTHGKLPKISIGEILSGKKEKLPSSMNKNSRKLISACWSMDPDDRPSFDDIVDKIQEHDFELINGIDSQLSEIKSFLSI